VSIPTVASLSRALGKELAPVPGFDAPDCQISAVHISELLDPTGYLSGGELLLTTGLSLPHNRLDCERYVGRLVDVGLTALAVGLGPVHTDIPSLLADACHKFGLPLLCVPAPTPFLNITKAYWAAVSRSTEQHLKDVLATQRALVDAAASLDPVNAVLRTLSRSLDGWAAVFTSSGDIDHVSPAGAAEEAEEVSNDLLALEGAGLHSAASFSTQSSTVIVFPLAVEQTVTGFLAVGTSSPLEPSRRRAALTASALLSLDAVRRSRAESVAREAQRCVGLLVDLGYIEAARRLAPVVHAPIPPDQVRLLAVRGRESDVLITVTQRWCPDAITLQGDRRTLWLLLPARHPSTQSLDASLARMDGTTSALISDIIPVEQTARVRAMLTSSLTRLDPGTRRLTEASDPYVREHATRMAAAVEQLPDSLVDALASYLRHHGQWEPASRSLDIHRNTLRHRIRRCENALRIDLGDPDVRAELWLLLRRGGHA
jgi:purine catabolism regulator